MGTGDFAVPPLLALLESRHEVVVAISQPDRPSGRGLKTIPTPVHSAAAARGVPVWQPESLRDAPARDELMSYQPELVVVAAYGRILPSWVWTDPPLGAINIHGSILPRYRGAAPIQRAVINGDLDTGVTIVKVAPEVDTGEILLIAKQPIEADDTAGDMFGKLSLAGAKLLLDALDLIESGRAVWQPQPDGATQAPKIAKTEARLNWAGDSINLKNLVRGLNPNPGAHFMFEGRRIKVWRAAARPLAAPATPGTIVEVTQAGPVIACGSGAMILVELQPAGRARLTGAEFDRGYRPQPGAVLE
jgi:methionyl-tRNA formyltransferase